LSGTRFSRRGKLRPIKLAYSRASPYLRKVNICAEELGVASRIENVPHEGFAARLATLRIDLCRYGPDSRL
jgi:hypothetical protein